MQNLQPNDFAKGQSRLAPGRLVAVCSYPECLKWRKHIKSIALIFVLLMGSAQASSLTTRPASADLHQAADKLAEARDTAFHATVAAQLRFDKTELGLSLKQAIHDASSKTDLKAAVKRYEEACTASVEADEAVQAAEREVSKAMEEFNRFEAAALPK